MKVVKLTIVAMISVLVASCSWGPGSLDETKDQILTIAYKSPDANFQTIKTYALADSMSVVVDGQKKRVKNATSDAIFSQIAQNLNKLGYTQVQPQNEPDAIVDLGYIQSTRTAVFPGYWSDWDWWWDYYHYPWYPWDPYYPYPMPTVVTSYTTGTVVIEMADMAKVKDQTVPIVWHGVIRGILNGSHTPTQLTEAINEVFTILPPK
ncbi:MAG: DUF4136 domain-containing protein [Bacteroidales bacterium]|nr:DUF4136 domain-containing protein [Bacteroidales bacterium]